MQVDGTFRGEILEFPGCIASGETAAETLNSLEDAADGWIRAAMAAGQPIPGPIENNNDYSGKLVLRIPKSLHKKATRIAEREGVSLNQFITSSLAQSVGEKYYSRSFVSATTTITSNIITDWIDSKFTAIGNAVTSFTPQAFGQEGLSNINQFAGMLSTVHVVSGLERFNARD